MARSFDRVADIYDETRRMPAEALKGQTRLMVLKGSARIADQRY